MKGDYIKAVVEKLSGSEAKIWARVKSDLSKPTRNRRIVNLSKLDAFVKDGFTLVVPGNVLSDGQITKKVNVAALKFTQAAQSKIEAAGGSVMTLEDCMKKNPDGKKLILLG